jgi:hypothetical protein
VNARSELVTFRISGVAWGVLEGSELSSNAQAYDPGSQDAIEALAAIQGALRYRVGRGHSYAVAATVGGASCLADYFHTMADVYLGGGVDPDARKEGRACAAVARTIDAALTARARALAIKPRNGGQL